MTPKTTAKHTGCAVAVALIALLSAVQTSEGTLPFTDSPLLSYGWPFNIYSSQWNSYCNYIPQGGIECDLGITNKTLASRFYIKGGCGYITASNTAANALALYPNSGGSDWFSLEPALLDSTRTIFGGFNIANNQFAFSNYVPVADGYLHGGVSQVQWIVPGDGWCSAQPATINVGRVQCNRPTISAWEAFYFVPARMDS